MTNPAAMELPPLPEVQAWAKGFPASALPHLERAFATGVALAEGRIRPTSEPDPNDTNLGDAWGTLDADTLPPEVSQRCVMLVHAVYVRALAHRYIRDVGAVNLDDSGLGWERDRNGALPPASPREQLLTADGSPALSWREWLAARIAKGESHDSAALFDGLQATRVDLLERRLAMLEKGRSGRRLGSHAVRTFARSYEERKKAALNAYRKKKLTKEERDKFISDDAASLKGDELLVVALFLEYARQEGQLRSIPAANYKFGPLTLDVSLLVSDVSIEQMARDLGGDIEDSDRPKSQMREIVAEALKSLQAERLVLVEPREVRKTLEGGKRIRPGEVYLETARLVAETKTPDGERFWKLHPSLALGYHRGAVYLDRAAWKRGQQHIGARYLGEEMTRADVYFRMLAPAVVKERQDEEEVISAEAGVSKRLKTSTLLDKFGMTSDAERGQTYVAKRLEKVLGFCVGTGALIGWERWEGAPRRKGAAPELKGYTVRLTVPPMAEAEELPLFPELEDAVLALPAGEA